MERWLETDGCIRWMLWFLNADTSVLLGVGDNISSKSRHEGVAIYLCFI